MSHAFSPQAFPEVPSLDRGRLTDMEKRPQPVFVMLMNTDSWRRFEHQLKKLSFSLRSCTSPSHPLSSRAGTHISVSATSKAACV